MTTQPKLWSERDFDECCYVVSGLSNLSMVCATPCRGSYCDTHREELATTVLEAERTQQERDRISALARYKRAQARAAEALPPAPVVPPQPALQTIIKLVADRHGVTVAEIKSASRHKRLIPARQEFFYLAHKAGKSYPQAALYCGGRDHSTAMYGKRRHEERMGR
jgi:chromosomal replication initiation ATPase DnaA